jgi:hypothetical protein
VEDAVFGPAITIKNLLDLQAEIRGKVDSGEYAIEIDQLPQPTDPVTAIEMQGLHTRIILNGPGNGGMT